jgi:hypothetical protein
MKRPTSTTNTRHPEHKFHDCQWTHFENPTRINNLTFGSHTCWVILAKVCVNEVETRIKFLGSLDRNHMNQQTGIG